MKVVIHQPNYLPYPGFFHKLSLADVYVVMDRAQFTRGFINRNRILDTHGPLWLTVPVRKDQKFSSIMDVEVNRHLPWREDHWRKILISYSNSRYFHLYRDQLERVYDREWTDLTSLNLETLRISMGWVGIHLKIVRESELSVSSQGTQRLVDICELVGADTYISGKGGKEYMDESLFASHGLELVYALNPGSPYPQRFSSVFVPDLSILDMVANVSPDDLRPTIAGAVPMPATS
ncbi:MAG: WbqC family protein [Thaumarchaeota archaeon]|nr:WbqC family protein [Nitrososphaerota archaeon]